MMASPSLDESEGRLLIRLLTSNESSTLEMGLMHLKYRITSRSDDLGSNNSARLLQPVSTEDISLKDEGSRQVSILILSAVVLLAVLTDFVYFLNDFLTHQTPVSLRMLQSHTLESLGVVLVFRAALKGDLVKAVHLMQATVAMTICLHALYVGFGLYAPSIPFLGLIIIANIVERAKTRTLLYTLISLGLLSIITALNLNPSTAAYVNQAVPLQHLLANIFLFPVVCALVVRSQLNNYVSPPM
jgi:hypothetical protein